MSKYNKFNPLWKSGTSGDDYHYRLIASTDDGKYEVYVGRRGTGADLVCVTNQIHHQPGHDWHNTPIRFRVASKVIYRLDTDGPINITQWVRKFENNLRKQDEKLGERIADLERERADVRVILNG